MKIIPTEPFAILSVLSYAFDPAATVPLATDA
jgi:hypothetical protein